MPFQLRATMLAGAACVALMTCPASARPQANMRYDIPAQDLGEALRQVGRNTGVDIMFQPGDVAGITAPAIRGDLTISQAIDRLLAGTGLTASYADGTVVIRGRSAPSRGEGSPAAEIDPDIVVTGSRIRGAPIASPVIVVNQEQIRNAGQSSLGEVVRSIPQSFGGGQNPGVGTNVPASSGVDIGGGSSVNLRGLGSDATLTLLNGHRVSYSASRQSVDISAIPLAAVDRLEIVADGASALYGSDAVAGVANIILRRNVNGLEANAQLGSSTDGGNFQQLYGALGGASWSSGDLVAAYEYGSNSSILSRDRSYAATRAPGLTLYPALRHHNAILNGRQQLGHALTFEIDALYNNRRNSTVFPLNAAGNLDISAGRSFGRAESYAVTPVLRTDLPGDWQLALTGGYGHDRVDFAADLFFAGTKLSGGSGTYRNTATSVELGGDGSLFQLPAGPAKLALGAGYRRIGFSVFRGSASFQNVDRAQDSYFGYGELNLPLVGPSQGIRFVDRLNVSAALRYENYPGIGDVVTPKLGLIYAPSPDLSLKASWGRSFRAPTLLQQYNPASAVLVRAASVGSVGTPATATALLLQGGNAALDPERASTWSGTIDIHPLALPGFKVELSYFSTRYRDRIVTPIAATAVALSNPIYAAQIVRNPSQPTVATTISDAGTFINASGTAYDPATVVAIIDNSNVNAGRQQIDGIDASLSWRRDLGRPDRTVAVTLNAAYLDSEQQLSAGQPIVPLSGTIFNPPHFRGRGFITLASGPAALSLAINYAGPADDRRFASTARIGDVTTADLTARLATGRDAGLLGNLDLSLSLLNAFNAKPTPIRTTLFTDTPYDSTNYSPVGRVISVGVRKTW